MRHYLLRTTMFFSAVLLLSTAASAASTSATLESENQIDSKDPAVLESRLETSTIIIDYDRHRIGRYKTARPSISPPAAGALPSVLTVVRTNASADTSFRPQYTPAGLETRASVAATWTARQQIQIFGHREIYEAGFYDGLQQAFHDPLIGDWDHLQGDLAGSRDRQAYRIGSELGLRHARIRADQDAHARIAFQSQNTTSQVRRDTESSLNREGVVDELTALMPQVREPRLLDVFEDLPLSSVLERSEPGSLPDPLKLYRSSNYQDFYDHHWTEPESAFAYWLTHHRDRAFWQQLSEDERTGFAEIFRSAYRHQLPELLAGRGEQAYGDGYGDGWSYGVRVVQEWRRRQGYHEGFNAALQTHARSAYWKSYPSLFDDRYGELFRQWSATAKAETGEVALVDAPNLTRTQLSNLIDSGD